MLVVAKDGSGDFSNISDALAWFQENQEKSERVIFIRSGIYEERVEIRTPYLTLIGENAETTKITGHLYAKMPMEDIGKLGTFRTYTVFVDTHDFTACNLTLKILLGQGIILVRQWLFMQMAIGCYLKTANSWGVQTHYLPDLFHHMN